MTESRDAEQPRAPGGPAGLDDEMARELLEHYLAGAGERLSALEGALGACEAQPDDPASLEALRRVLHKTAGSAGTYGFPELTRSARQLEQGVVAARDAPPGTAALFAAGRAFQAEMVAAFDRAAQALRGDPAPAAEAPPARPGGAEGGAAGLPSAVRERLVVAVIGAGARPGAAAEAESGSADPGAAAVGAALAAAGTHLLGVGPEDAARAYRQAGGEGLVLWIVPGERSAASRSIDLPLCASTLLAQCAVAAAAADGAIVLGGGVEARAHCGFFLREGKPVVGLPAGGAASAPTGPELEVAGVVAATSAEDAVFELLTQLSARASAR